MLRPSERLGTLGGRMPRKATWETNISSVVDLLGSRAVVVSPERDREIARDIVRHFSAIPHPAGDLTSESVLKHLAHAGLSDEEIGALDRALPLVQVSNNVVDFLRPPHLRSVTPTSQFAAQVVHPGAGDCLLEVGCSAGRYLLPHAGTKARLVGVDICKLALEIGSAAWRKTQTDPEPEWIAASVLDMPLEDNSCTIVTGWVVLGFVPMRMALREIRRVLKLGGQLAFTVEGPGFLAQEWQQSTSTTSRIALLRWWLGSELMHRGLDWQGRKGIGRLAGVTQYRSKSLPRLLESEGFTVERVQVLTTYEGQERLVAVVARKG